MRILFYLLTICMFLINCTSTKNIDQNNNTSSLEDTWEIIILDPQYETFLISQQPKEFYSEQYLKPKNSLYVTEWNIRYSNPLRYNPDIYSVKIDYDTSKEYGLDFEYHLFMFFKFVEWKYQTKL